MFTLEIDYMSDAEIMTVRDIRNEGQKNLIKGACLVIILMYGLASHMPLLHLLGVTDGADTLFKVMLYWGLLSTNVYVVVAGYVALRWMAAGPEGDATMEAWFKGKVLRYCATIALAWLSIYWMFG